MDGVKSNEKTFRDYRLEHRFQIRETDQGKNQISISFPTGGHSTNEVIYLFISMSGKCVIHFYAFTLTIVYRLPMDFNESKKKKGKTESGVWAR
jgi:hypothetical protein